MAKTMGPFRDAHVPFWFSGPRTDVPAEPLSQVLHIPMMGHQRETVTINNYKYSD
jgi:hypothetical protein